jgi:rubrerythrin
MTQALKIALERERDSESNFRFLAERVPDTELGNLFAELADIEWKHKADLQAEYDASYAADPEQFLRDLS